MTEGNLFKRAHFLQRDPKKNVFKETKTKVIQISSVCIFWTAWLLWNDELIGFSWSPEVSMVWMSSGIWNTRPRQGRGSVGCRKAFAFNPFSQGNAGQWTYFLGSFGLLISKSQDPGEIITLSPNYPEHRVISELIFTAISQRELQKLEVVPLSGSIYIRKSAGDGVFAQGTS